KRKRANALRTWIKKRKLSAGFRNQLMHPLIVEGARVLNLRSHADKIRMDKLLERKAAKMARLAVRR
ncbi:MAG: hypothetical protein ACRED1_03125, partial [Limisphaerales bacterium]